MYRSNLRYSIRSKEIENQLVHNGRPCEPKYYILRIFKLIYLWKKI